ncbi:cation diffusion facilitator family transporter [Alteribacillus persepolensis]|uniref:Cation diffusion facilitator family transporter n=1 Tax=Alteribacillus persepolensis TaxID=568899 RepID=A0A1G8DI50_9BACI|nr:cation diffusion facilitator family transporter [Alteribacillus persepolensis]SDH57342.1 cation diffusion facilitator family transporter [Alteribacillus persepolensis]
MESYEERRYRMVRLGAFIGIFGNIFLALLKGIVGWLANSRALIADAVHSASDVAGSVAVFIGVRAAKLPPDKDHPYGHGKAETVTAIIVAVLLFIVGFEIGLDSLKDAGEPVSVPKMAALYAVIFSVVLKEAMFRYKHFLGTKYKSEALLTDAWHHRSDVFSSLAALLGIGASILGGKTDIAWLLYGDLAAGLFVAILIMRMAWKMGKESIHNALDHVLHAEDTAEMRTQVETVDGVIQIDEFFAREHGHYVIVDIKVAVDPAITVQEGHAIGKAVKEKLLQNEYIKDVFIHINPYESS